MVPKKYDTYIDGKWQLSLPVAAAKKFDGKNEVSVLVGENGCVAIYPSDAPKSRFDGTRVPLRRGQQRKYARVTIPQELRGTTSFHYGHTVTVACKRGFVEIWPRPSWSGSNRRIGRPPNKH